MSDPDVVFRGSDPTRWRGRHDGDRDLRRENLRGLLRDLRASDAWIDGLSFVADLDGEVVGHVLFTRSRLDAPRRLVDVLVLSPLAVRADVQGRGIGSDLVRYGLEQVRSRPEPAVFLEGSPPTTRGSASCREMGWASASRRSASPTRRSRWSRLRRTSRG